MDMMMISSAGNYAKSLRLQMQWNLKKNSGNLSAHVDSLADQLKPRKTMAASIYQSMIDRNNADSNDDDSQKMQKITDKLMHGDKLTKEERQYLQAKNPAMYQRVLAAEQDQKNYEQELKRCRTKDEVQRVRQTHLSSSMTTLTSMMNNPHISLEVLATEKYHFEKINTSTREFVRRGDFQQLPTDAEKAKADKIRAAEKREELGIEDNKKAELSESVRESDADELSESVSANDADKLSGTVGRQDSQRDTPAQSDSRSSSGANSHNASGTDSRSSSGAKLYNVSTTRGAKSHNVSTTRKAVRIETPEERKVRRARTRAARAAYSSWNSEISDFSVSVNA